MHAYLHQSKADWNFYGYFYASMQVKKDEEELTVGWGEGPKFNLPKRGPQLVEGKGGEKEVSGGAGLVRLVVLQASMAEHRVWNG